MSGAGPAWGPTWNPWSPGSLWSRGWRSPTAWSRPTSGLSAPLLKIDVPRVVLPEVEHFRVRPWVTPPFIERLRRVREALTAADLVPAPSMDEGLVDEVVEAHEGGASPEELGELVLSWYDAHESTRLAAVVDSLCESPHFADREATLRQTLEAHRLGLDAVTVYPLVPMVEGVLFPYLLTLTEEKKMSSNRAVKLLGGLPVYGVGLAGVSRLIGFMEASLYGQWRPGDRPEAVEERAELNRHRLAHGHLKAGTRLDARRCFLVLETVAALLGAWDELLLEAEEEEGG
ncbi:MAG: hypothetical protein M3R38_00745 [Actinomycetota bacterium]|nr:hypothetical protein [Actinomycetota bacterium]